jgi:long-chain acyl-CoA synthetase
MLTHKNLVWNADISTDVYIKVKPRYKILSILPVSHVYEFTIGQLLVLLCGCEIVYLGRPPAPSSLLPALKEVRPHAIMTVPLLIEKIYRSSVLPMLKKNTKLQRYLRFGITRRFICRIIGRKINVTMGGRVRFYGIGGAPLDREVEEFLAEAKFPYALGYGLTETSPLIAGGKPKNHTVGVIGKIVKHLEVRLEDRNPVTGVGEIAVKGPSVMQGYWNNPGLNEEAYTSDGFFRTGDLGRIDKKGRLAIMGRTKTMILGSSGENIYPELIEAVINNQDFVTESLVIPEDGALVALIKLDIEGFAQKMALSVNEAKTEAARYINKLREEVNKELNVFSRLSKVHLQEDDFERTPTQKIKRFLYLRKKDESSDA